MNTTLSPSTTPGPVTVTTEAPPDRAQAIMENFLRQIEEQLSKTIENIESYRKGLVKAEQIKARLEGQRDLANAFIAQYSGTPVTKA